jgi:DNA-binding XRE family transcriptional regulator
VTPEGKARALDNANGVALPGRTGKTSVNPRVVLGRRLAALRQAVGYTQALFAQKISYTRSTIAGTETGKQRPSREFWAHADALLGAGGELVAAHDRVKAAENAARGQQIQPGIAAAGDGSGFSSFGYIPGS